MAGMLILASSSPRRREILQAAGIEFAIRPAELDETVLPGEDAPSYVRRLARAKAAAIAAGPGDMVLGADTVVVVDGEILGKPAGPEDACRMLRRLAGREHAVMTGICLRRAGAASGTLVEDVAVTWVRFVPLSEDEIVKYVESGEPLDKAGAYAIQGLASKFVDRIAGCYFNVVGLPVALVYKHLRQLGG
jgi:septum formation protein